MSDKPNDRYDFGDAMERVFVGVVAPKVGINAVIHPEKAHDPTYPDLLIDGSQVGDLKVRNKPWFKSWDMFGILPQYAVAFDLHDWEKYKTHYPDIIVYFWVNWTEREGKFGSWKYVVEPMNLVYSATLKQIEDAATSVHTRNNSATVTSRRHRDGIMMDIRDLTLHPWIKE